MKNAMTQVNRRIVGRLEKGDDLHFALKEIFDKNNISAGEIRGLGATTFLAVTEYDMKAGKYKEPLVRDDAAEILMLYGNVSLLDGEVFAHLHITASYFDSGEVKMIAGHVSKATLFALEYVIDVYDDLELVRESDEPTGLKLWGDVKVKS